MVDARRSRVVAPRFVGQRRLVEAEHVVEAVGPGQLLVEVRANAICGTDRDLWENGWPVTPGHEAAGVVVGVGPGTITAPGTLGVVYLMDFCGTCRSCRLGATNQCLAKRGDFGFTRDGGYGPLAVVSESAFFPIDHDIDPAEATLLLDVMGTSGHAIARARLIRPDIESVVIAGAGPIGLGLAAMVRILLGSATTVIVGDVDTARLAIAETLGARVADLRSTSMADAMRASGSDGGADAAFDSAGRTVTREGLLEALGKRGVLVCVGHGEGLTLDVSRDLIGPERAVLGSEYFRFDALPANLALLRAHRAVLATIITHRFPRSRLGEALATFFAGGTGKVIVEA